MRKNKKKECKNHRKVKIMSRIGLVFFLICPGLLLINVSSLINRICIGLFFVFLGSLFSLPRVWLEYKEFRNGGRYDEYYKMQLILSLVGFPLTAIGSIFGFIFIVSR